MSDTNVLLVILDSVRAKNTSLHGHKHDTTPFLDEFASESVVYDQARSPGIHSISSHVSIFTGYEVAEHGVFGHTSTIDPSETIWAELSAKGYETGLFTPNIVVGEASNLADCFDVIEGGKRLFPEAMSPDEFVGNISIQEYVRKCIKDERPLQSFLNGVETYFKPSNAHSPKREAANVYVDDFLNWFTERDGPWAACLNLMDAHYPYLPKDEFDEWGGKQLQKIHKDLPKGPLTRTFLTGECPMWQLEALENLYDGGIRQMDHALRNLIGELRRSGALNNTLLVITSDHGEGFGEHSLLDPRTPIIDHSWGIEEIQTHVPLVVRYPDGPTGRRISNLATLSKFPEVVRSVQTGDACADSFCPSDGQVVVSTFRMADPEKLPDTVADKDRFRGPWRAVYQLRDGTVFKYADRGEDSVKLEVPNAQMAYKIKDSDGDYVSKVFNEMERYDIEKSRRDVSNATEQRLEDLGYV
ncbi:MULTISPECIES: sulfatase-like hydrolase/transferase [Haloferax]|uniref:Sulfatase n=1 Tax=Haloferax lucentense (strain DSM 14919 / JCM 9276 / NCIMB 13854 / Aa 2.2) TaxID=1230452 RepID=M0GSS7_HALL2|nr:MULTISPECIES: sulfatase-like hydrolase/transferase [Haloferax]ELK54576.1 sulfatase [Haloferax sp. BAB-2207]ELZ74572.1 sulfatase [Haloferax lucentense DSM 14919]RDZ37932.1 sulfatase [Haloferax sp. Atlit-24N]RLM38727.1 sulfatase [Haloferax sp. Atlit-109R]RLM46675.1 sulfatase [Haloferax sp. Atlit-105R]